MKRAVLLAAVAVLSVAAQAQNIQINKDNRTIAITADDKASAPAEIATVSVGFQIYAPDADTAYSHGSQISNAILDALKKAGVADTAIESRDQNLSQTQFPFNNQVTPEERKQKEFTLSQSWAVHTAAADAAKILHVAIEAGANQSGNIEWDVRDRSALQAQAAAKALVRARAVATQMATGLGVQLGPLLYASNQMPTQPVLPMARMEKFGGAAAARAPQPLALRPQEVEETATVYAIFSIE